MGKIPLHVPQASVPIPAHWYINHYHCDRCDNEWQDENDCKCDDRCPSCDVAHSPYKSEEITGNS